MCTENDSLIIVGNQCGGLFCRISNKILPFNKLLVLLDIFGEPVACDIDGCENCHRLKHWKSEDEVCQLYASL